MAEQQAIVAEHWIPALAELARQTSHEVRNALNGVSVNLEVVSSRLERAVELGDPVAAATVPFVRSAVEQLEQLAGITESFLSLSRSTSSASTDLLPLVTRATLLARHIARSEGRGVTFTAVGDAETSTSTSCDVARLLVVRLLLDALAARIDIHVELGPDTAGVRLAVRSSGNGSLNAPHSGLVTVAETAGVQVVQNAAGWYMAFPASPRRDS